MLWVYCNYKFLIFFSAGIVFRRQILMSKDGPRAERFKFDERWSRVGGLESTFCRATINDYDPDVRTIYVSYESMENSCCVLVFIDVWDPYIRA